MSLSVSAARVKEKCGISDATYDVAIDHIIADYVPAIEFAIRSEFIAATSEAGLQATLNLGALEICCGEFMAQKFRESGTPLTVMPDGYELLRFFHGSARDPSGLVEAGWTRLRPYLGQSLELAVRSGILSSSEEVIET